MITGNDNCIQFRGLGMRQRWPHGFVAVMMKVNLLKTQVAAMVHIRISTYIAAVPDITDRLRRLKRLRRCKNAEIAVACGVSQQAVGGWFRGAMPKPAHLVTLADFFGVPLSYLLNGDASPARAESLARIEEGMAYLTDAELNVIVMMIAALRQARS